VYKIQSQLYPELGQHSETTYSPIHNRNCNKLIFAQNELPTLLHQIIYHLEYGSRSILLFPSQNCLRRNNAKMLAKMTANASQKENSEIGPQEKASDMKS
jgi:hypothetical protein